MAASTPTPRRTNKDSRTVSRAVRRNGGCREYSQTARRKSIALSRKLRVSDDMARLGMARDRMPPGQARYEAARNISPRRIVGAPVNSPFFSLEAESKCQQDADGPEEPRSRREDVPQPGEIGYQPDQRHDREHSQLLDKASARPPQARPGAVVPGIGQEAATMGAGGQAVVPGQLVGQMLAVPEEQGLGVERVDEPEGMAALAAVDDPLL